VPETDAEEEEDVPALKDRIAAMNIGATSSGNASVYYLSN